MPRSAHNPAHALTEQAEKDRDDVLVEFGKTVRQHREARSLTIEELAERSTLHASYVGQVERGTRNLSLFNVWRLACGLEMPPASLMEGLPRGMRKPRPQR